MAIELCRWFRRTCRATRNATCVYDYTPDDCVDDCVLFWAIWGDDTLLEKYTHGAQLLRVRTPKDPTELVSPGSCRAQYGQVQWFGELVRGTRPRVVGVEDSDRLLHGRPQRRGELHSVAYDRLQGELAGRESHEGDHRRSGKESARLFKTKFPY